MAERIVLTPLFEEVDNGWIQARIKELPEVISVAPTRGQAHEMLQDALSEYWASLRDEGKPLPIEAERDQLSLASI
jgi:predicted RNase H-like HicB family nuclease